MFYEIQFQQAELTQLTETSLESSIEEICSTTIIFDESKNCLFLNDAAEQVFNNRSDISLLGDWIREHIKRYPEESLVLKLEEIPFKIAVIDQWRQQLEIWIKKQDISERLWSDLNQHKLLAIREPKIRPTYTSKLKVIPSQCLSTTINYDRLTGLPNYNFLLENIEQEINFCQSRVGYQFVILFVDVNRFKAINSSLGRILGDRLLIAISDRLQTCLRSQDLIARMGNDEFAILLGNVEQIQYATNVAERIYRQLGIPFNLGGYEVFIEASIGIAVGNKDYYQPEDLLRDVELAVSDAKRQNKLPYQIFNQSMRGKALTLLQLENDLRRAIKRQEFILHYQPIVSLRNNKIKGFEVLVRWRHPEKGTISPGEFIPLAEDTGLIIPIGFWVLQEACEQMYQWQTKFGRLADWKVSVNISSKQLSMPNFVAQVQQILRDSQLNPHNLKLEITESSLVEDTQHTITVLKELKSIGIEFSLD
ncbi:MAG: EAL domain-containing protein, partial [Cyanobacteria bacterium J06558_2]